LNTIENVHLKCTHRHPYPLQISKYATAVKLKCIYIKMKITLNGWQKLFTTYPQLAQGGTGYSLDLVKLTDFQVFPMEASVFIKPPDIYS